MADNETQLYKKRWVFLAVLAVLQVLGGWAFTSFGQISNFYVTFFNVSYSQVDWITIAITAGPLVSTVPFAWMAYKGYLGFRNFAIFSAASSTLGYFCLSLSTIARTCFPVVVLGQVINGFMGQVLLAIPPSFAVLWFPENEVGTAISINTLGMFLGASLGLLIPTNALYLRFSNSSNISEILDKDNGILRKIYICFTAIPLVITIIFVIFVTDRPPKPPSLPQSLKVDKQSGNLVGSGGFLKQTKLIMTNKTYILAVLVVGIVLHTPIIEYTMMSQILKPFIVQHDVMGAYVMAIYCAGSVLGSLVSGKVVNIYKRYKVLSILGSGVAFLSSAGIVVATYYESYISICISNFLLGLGTQLVMITAYEIATQQTYPIDETVVGIWLVGFVNPVTIFYGEVGRVIFHASGSVAVLAFQSANILLALILCCLYDTKNKRLDAAELPETLCDNATPEKTRLLN